MSCNPCQPVEVCCPENVTYEYTFENQGTSGVGVFDNATGLLIGFRNLVSASLALTIVLDAPNRTIIFDFDGTLLVADLPDATTTQRGVLETATDAEALAKAATDKILTPSNLAAIGATQAFAGLIEIATNAEAIAGVLATVAITPASLSAVVATLEQTTTFADAVARAAAVPAFEGQFGFQLDTNEAFAANGAGAGAWANILIEGATQVFTSATTLTLAGVSLTIDGSGTLNLATTTVNTANTTWNHVCTNFNITTTTTLLSAANFSIIGAAIDFDTCTLLINNVNVPAASVLITAGLATPSSKLINEFISTDNTQTGYTAFANGAVLRTCDTTTVTLPQLAQIVGTLIEDLKAVNLPST